jgi:hypothetical protein|nr:MAG TPA: hypothetical protein [Caudoviricetes sp.]
MLLKEQLNNIYQTKGNYEHPQMGFIEGYLFQGFYKGLSKLFDPDKLGDFLEKSKSHKNIRITDEEHIIKLFQNIFYRVNWEQARNPFLAVIPLPETRKETLVLCFWDSQDPENNLYAFGCHTNGNLTITTTMMKIKEELFQDILEPNSVREDMLFEIYKQATMEMQAMDEFKKNMLSNLLNNLLHD